MPDPESKLRELRADLERLREEVEHTRERLGYALAQVAELRRQIPSGGVTQSAAPGGEPAQARDPIERLFAAIRRTRR